MADPKRPTDAKETVTGAALARSPETREMRIALVVTAAVLFGVLALQAAVHADRRYDFGVRYVSGLIIRQGNGAKLYDLQKQAEVERVVLKRWDPLPIIHTPFEAAAFVPFSLLPYGWAYLAWGAINIALWIFFAYCLRPYVPVPSQPFRYLVLCFAFFPAWIALVQGQTTIVLLLIFTLVFISLKQERDLRAGILLGLGLFRFQIVLPFAAIVLLRGSWRVAAGFTLSATALATVSFLVVGMEGIRSYILMMLDLTKHSTQILYAVITPRGMPTLRGFFGTLLGGRLASIWSTAIIAILGLSLIVLAYWQWQGDRPLHRKFSCALVTSILAGYHVYPHDLVLLLVPILLMAGEISHAAIQAAVVVLYLPLYPIFARFDSLYLFFCPVAILASGLFGAFESRGRTLNRHLP